MKTFFSKINQVLHSRTFWTILVMCLINGITPVRTLIPAHWLPVVDSFLGVLATLFHVFPSQNYTAPNDPE